MARPVIVIALIFVAVVGVAMASEAPSSSPKSSPKTSPAPSSTPKASAPVAASPKSSPAPPTPFESSPVASPPEEEDSFDFDAPAPGPGGDEFVDEESAVPEEEEITSRASSLQVSVVVAAVAAGFFAF